jgi:GT2 family glycosyltransferase
VNHARPFVSVVVPTCGRPDALRRCLLSLATQDYGTDAFEVIVIDDGSPEPVELPGEIRGRMAVTVQHQARAGPAAARNRGLKAARGDYIAFLDDDCEASSAWLHELVASLEAHSGAGAGGTVVNGLEKNLFAEASQTLVSFLCAYYNADPQNARFFTSNNLAFPRAALMESGGFDAEYQRAAAEDRELCDRWRRQGRRLVTASRAVVRHEHNLTFVRFWRQHFVYGSGAWHYWRHRASGRASRVKVEPLAFYRRLLTWPIRMHGASGTPVALLLVMAQFANAAGFVTEACRPERRVT